MTIFTNIVIRRNRNLLDEVDPAILKAAKIAAQEGRKYSPTSTAQDGSVHEEQGEAERSGISAHGEREKAP